jgi:phage tail-like protein
MPKERKNPYSGFNFRVDFANGVTASFSEISGLDAEQEVIMYRTGAEETVPHKIPGLQKYPNVVLKRGIIGTDNIWKWRALIIQGLGGDDIENEARTTVHVHLLDEKREPVVTWKIKKAWPVKWAGPALAAGKNETALESLELAHEGIEMEP